MTSLLALPAGGVGLFLLGMWLMTGGLKLLSGSALRTILESWTRTSLRGFAAGLFITALVQSSSATTVATIGFVNAGLLTLSQAIWVVIGANVGTTMTGWIVALAGIKIQMGALAMPLIGVGMLTRLLGRTGSRLAGFGQALAGFGVFFLGIDALQEGFSALTPLLDRLDLETAGWTAMALFLGLGIGLTVITQSSSAAIAITLTASAAGEVPLDLAAVAAIGTNVGTTSTAAFAAISATSAARRVAVAHILFNVVTAIAALLLLDWLLVASDALTAFFGSQGDLPIRLAVFHTLFNIMGAAIVWPFVRRLTVYLRSLFVTPTEMVAVPRYLDRTLVNVPDLALQALARELKRMARIAFRLGRDILEQQPSVAEGRVQGERNGLALLSQEILMFADRIAESGPSATVAAGLQDLIRATQHLNDLSAAIMSHARQSQNPAAEPVAEWTALRDTAMTCLTLRGKGEPQFLTLEDAASLQERIEGGYQQIKTKLLRAASVGTMPVAEMDEALTTVQTIRRMATIALKVQRRLTLSAPGNGDT